MNSRLAAFSQRHFRSETASPAQPQKQVRNTKVQKSDPNIIDVPTLGMWLFLASEAMFFVAMLGGFVVLESTGQQHAMFVKSSQMLSGWILIGSIVMLALSSLALSQHRSSLPWISVLMGIVFILLLAGQWLLLLEHHTCVARLEGHAVVLDGSESTDGNTLVVNARKSELADGFDIHSTTASDFVGQRQFSTVKDQDVLQDSDYGPSRNNFFASYFLMSAAHGVHLIAGLAALLWFLLFRRGRIPTALQNYWHFVNVVGILGLLTVYFV
jgi:heme/copper-type cytochrome/quinol oxidase subunit 3